MKNSSGSDLRIQVAYAENQARAEAALAILRQGFRRAFIRAAAERADRRKKDGVA